MQRCVHEREPGVRCLGNYMEAEREKTTIPEQRECATLSVSCVCVTRKQFTTESNKYSYAEVIEEGEGKWGIFEATHNRHQQVSV